MTSFSAVRVVRGYYEPDRFTTFTKTSDETLLIQNNDETNFRKLLQVVVKEVSLNIVDEENFYCWYYPESKFVSVMNQEECVYFFFPGSVVFNVEMPEVGVQSIFAGVPSIKGEYDINFTLGEIMRSDV